MGNVVNLVDCWDPFKAAKAALASALEPKNVKQAALKAKEAINVSFGP